MEDFSDGTNRIIIIITIFIYYLYLKYRQTQLLMLKHVQNVEVMEKFKAMRMFLSKFLKVLMTARE